MSEVVSSMEGSDDALLSLNLAAEALEGAGADMLLVPDGAGLAGGLLPRASLLSPRAPSAAIFPSNLLGKTFVFDTELDRYRVAPDVTGAPANGVRFIYYAIDPITKAPVEPLIRRGYLDLTDEGSASAVQVGLLVVDESVSPSRTLIDYSIAGSYTATENSITLHLEGDGYLSDGTEELDFELGYALIFTEGAEAIGIEIDHLVSVPSREVEIELIAEGAVRFGQEDPSELAGSMTIGSGPNSSVLDFTLEGETLEGTLEHNGEPLVFISGSVHNPTFTGADGGPLTAAEAAALHAIWLAVEGLMKFSEAIFHPFADA
jgi:hypothetical protein